MAMTLVWHDAKSFRQHLEHMRVFRQAHRRDPGRRLALLKDMPDLGNIHPPGETGEGRGPISARGRSAPVPVWEIRLPGNSQN